MFYSKIIATGSYLPDNILTNADLTNIVDTSADWIISRTGIAQRHVAAQDESTLDMAYQAALCALANSSLTTQDIDMIIVATSTPDIIFPSTACLLQHKLGITHASAAFDMQAACSGFLYALTAADGYIHTSLANNILIVGVDKVTRLVDYTDRNTCVLFGDGAGAVIVSASNEPGILGALIRSDGSLHNILHCTGKPQHEHEFIQMDGPAVFKTAVKVLVAISTELLHKLQLTTQDIDWIVPHQANLRIIETTSKMLGIDMQKVIVTVDKHGNTSAASIPLALDSAIKAGKILPNNTVLLQAVGGGITWGALVIRI